MPKELKTFPSRESDASPVPSTARAPYTDADRSSVGGRDKPLVVVGVPTCGRPKMLARCLASLMLQETDDRFDYIVCVVMNGPRDEHTVTVLGHAGNQTKMSLQVVHVPERGISQARNAVLEYALEIGADQIAFVDDDAVADPDWLAALMHPDYADVPVLAGRNIYEYPSPLPPWVFENDKPFVEGKRRPTAGSGNIRFSTDLVRAHLWFDERLGLVGGEDERFFTEASQRGFEIRQTARAVTRETAHPERLTYLAQVRRTFARGTSEPYTLTVMLAKLFLGLVNGVAHMIAAAAVLPFDRTHARRLTLRGGKKLAKAVGRFAGLVGCTPKPYRVIQGN